MKRILHPTDFSESAAKAEDEAVMLLRALKGELLLLHVAVEAPLYNEAMFGLVNPQAVYDAQRKWAEEQLEKRAADLRSAGVITRCIARSGPPAETIAEVAKEEACDLIVMGTRGLSGLNRFLVGSVADGVVRMASCPVMTVKT